MLNKKGLTQREVLNILNDKYFRKDLTYISGKIVGSMVGRPQSFAERIYSMCLEKDTGLPDVFQGTATLEKETIQTIGSLFSNPQAAGHIVSGGTEANLIAMWVARNSAKKQNPEIIVPESRHFSFDKIADILGLNLKITPLKNFKADPKEIEKEITSNTIAIVGTAGTTELGMVDPIDKLSKIASDHDIYLHVDAAFGGFAIPFLKGMGHELPDFDFKLNGVCSITVDPHKWLRIPPPAGGILFKNESFFKNISININYLHGLGAPNRTILGTRPAAPTIATWAVLQKMGEEGLKNEVRYSMEITNSLYKKIKKLKHIQPITQPEINIIGITSDVLSPEEISEELRKSGIVLFTFKNSARIVLLPYLMRAHIEEVMIALEKLDEKLGG